MFKSVRYTNLRNVRAKDASLQKWQLISNTWHYADIDVITKRLRLWPPRWEETTRTEAIYKESHTMYWRFLSTGTYSTGHEIENLYSAYLAKEIDNGKV